MSATASALQIAETVNLWSVTTLQRMGMPKGEGLLRWERRQGTNLAVARHELLGRMIAEQGEEAASDWLAGEAERRSYRAKARGTEIHAAAEALALGEPPRIDEEYLPYVEQLRRWLDTYEPVFLMAEAPVYNLTHRYAGTLDGVMRLGESEPLVFDYKTTEKPPTADSRPPYPEVALQMCAYSRAEEVGLLAEQRYAGNRRYYVYDPTVRHEPMIEVSHEYALCIVISPYDCYAVPVSIGADVWRAWLSVKNVALFQQEMARKVLGTPIRVREQ